jgi:hypothetical protein
MDNALNDLLLDNNIDALARYDQAMAKYPVGSTVPGKYDYDPELMTDETREKLKVALAEVGYKGDDIDGFYSRTLDKVKRQDDLTDNQYKAFDLIGRAGLRIKADLLLKAYICTVLPYITKVYNVQKKSGPGILDATVEWKGYGKIIVDNKTSSQAYPDNAVEYSAQLAMYAAEEGISSVAFVVLVKNLKKNREKICGVCGHRGQGSHKTCNNEIDGKRCGGPWEITIQPEAEIQIVHGDVTKEMMNVASELQKEVGRAVEARIFPCNVANCNSQYGKACEYKDLKWKGSMRGLMKVEYKK